MLEGKKEREAEGRIVLDAVEKLILVLIHRTFISILIHKNSFFCN